MIDLMKIARTEADNGDLFGELEKIHRPSDVRPDGHPEAVIWEGGNFTGDANPVAHSLTDAYALLGTIAAADVLGLPYYAVPMWSQYRHDQKLAPLSWFGNMPVTSIKWSTAGDAYVNDGKGGRVVVMGKSGNAPLRTQAGVYCNVRPYGPITCVRCMPCLPYSQDRAKFNVDPKTGIVHSEMNTPGVQMAYANRLFLKMVHESGKHGPRRDQADPGHGGRHQRRPARLAARKAPSSRSDGSTPSNPYEEHQARASTPGHQAAAGRTSRTAWRTGAAGSSSTSPTRTTA